RHEPTYVFEPIGPQRLAGDRLARYEVAYRALEVGNAEAARLIDELYREDPKDPCVAFHHKRLAAGQGGTVVVMTEEQRVYDGRSLSWWRWLCLSPRRRRRPATTEAQRLTNWDAGRQRSASGTSWQPPSIGQRRFGSAGRSALWILSRRPSHGAVRPIA